MARRKHQIPESLLAYYSQSVGASVLNAYRQHKVVIVDADQPPVQQDTPEIHEAASVLAAIQDEIDAAYWLFSRSHSRGPGKLADPTLYARRNAAHEHLMDLKRQAARRSTATTRGETL
jgi:hypothetical protein